MFPIVVAMIVYALCYIHDFPGGAQGFWCATKAWLKRGK